MIALWIITATIVLGAVLVIAKNSKNNYLLPWERDSTGNPKKKK